MVDVIARSPLSGVHVRLVGQRDTSDSILQTTDVYGGFSFTNLKEKSYRFEATLIGRAKVTRTFQTRTKTGIGRSMPVSATGTGTHP